MNCWITIGLFLLASVIYAQDEWHKEIKSQADVFWQDPTAWGRQLSGFGCRSKRFVMPQDNYEEFA